MTNHDLPEILPLRPHLREVVWGGRRLARLWGKRLPPGRPIGEAFEVSALPGRESVVSDGPLAGQALGGLVRAHGADLVGAAVVERYGDRFPLLIKLIDAEDDLSIQVHPDDAYARSHGLGPFGKTEAWYVLHSDDGRVALGLEDGVDAQRLAAAVARGRAEEVVTFQSVAAGDVICLPAGTVHALCRGVVVYEVQQASDLTFRLYDYDRPGLDGRRRELHVDQGIAVTDFQAPRPPVRPAPARAGTATLIDVDCFRLELIHGQSATVDTSLCCAAVTAIAGTLTLTGARGAFDLATGASALLPARGHVRVSPHSRRARCLVATPAI